ncbi:MAG: hypothetical protein IKT59_04140 [Bacteroidales bacterium]|nr:hypothetical protein [Bacteroidales bacterium]
MVYNILSIFNEIIGVTLLIVFSLIAVIAIIHIIAKRARRNSPYETCFGAEVSQHEETRMYVLVIVGCRDLWEGDYHVLFRMADGSDIALCDLQRNVSRNHFVKNFTRKERGNGFVFVQCRPGKHLLVIDMVNEYMKQTLYVPFEIKDDPQEIFQCRED